MLKSSRLCFVKTSLSVLFISLGVNAVAQDNSPYSRYGLGNLAPSSNVSTRGMGGISAGYADILSVNFYNPASYSQFQAIKEQRSKRLASGRVILDVGLSFDNRTLVQPNTPNKFTSADALFSYLQVGIPLRKNWGLSFGLRPLSRINYLVNRTERLTDPNTGSFIDSASTQYQGTGGSYLPTIGTGFGIGNLSAGINLGYLFGSSDISTRRSIINSLDTLSFHPSDHTTSTSFGGLFFNAGLQYKINLNKETFIRLGVSGNWEQKLNASRDILTQTYYRGTAGEELRLDSVYQENGIKGKIVYPASYKGGFVVQRSKADYSGWLLGVDYTQSKWSNYRSFDQPDQVQDNWQINVGGQLNPKPGQGFFTRTAYRFGFFTGTDYINVQNKNLPITGGSLGFALPITNYNRLSPGYFSVINIALEYAKRGNSGSPLKENLFRISVGLNFTDLWFGKRKYE
jgi:hypothetical protein